MPPLLYLFSHASFNYITVSAICKRTTSGLFSGPQPVTTGFSEYVFAPKTLKTLTVSSTMGHRNVEASGA